MKIVEVIPTLNVGGAEKFVVNLSAHLSDLGHECHLVTLFDASSNPGCRSSFICCQEFFG